MRYDHVQSVIDKQFQDNWTATALAFENQPFNTDIYEEFTRITVQFGDSILMALGTRCYRTPGIVFVDFFVRPGVGSNRITQLAKMVTDLFIGTIIGDEVKIYFLEPSLSKNYAERTGWVSAQLRLSFYFDSEA